MNARSAATVALHVVENLMEGCQVIGPGYEYLYINEAGARQGRRPVEELVGRTMTECYPGIEATPMFATLERCMRERAHARLENEFTYPDGSTGWFELRFVPVPEGVCILSLDITDQRRAAEAIRRAEETLRLLIDAVRDYAIYVVDPQGRIVTWNAGAERLKGYRPDEIIGRDVRMLYPADGTARAEVDGLFARALAAGRAEAEGWHVAKSGQRFWAHEVVTPVRDGSGRHVGFAKVVRDLTQYRKLEEQYRQAQKMEAVGRLAGGIAHDFNNLLSVILSYSSLSIATLAPQDPLRADLEEIEKAGERAAGLTRQLLAFSRQQVIEPRVLDLNQAVSGLERMLRRLAGEDVHIQLALADNLARVRVDPGAIEQVIMNLVVNARDAMPDGGSLVIETANIDLDESYAREHLAVTPGPHVMLAVSDTGHGMTPEVQARIFEPFFTTKETGKGTGLGLSTVFGIVQQSRGSIWVYSELDKGTTFKVFLPVTEEREQRRRQPSLVREVRGSETILLVEDDDQLRVVARGVLERQGYRVLEARNGGEALMLVEDYPARIDLLLTDVIMPKMSGSKLAKRLTTLRPELRVLYMSGYTDNSIVHHGVLEEGVQLVQKPITPDLLVRRVREVLDA